MLHIDSTKFGEVIIHPVKSPINRGSPKAKFNGVNKYHQVLIIGDKIEERDYKKLHELFDSSHKIGDWEIEKLLKGDPQVIIVGTGQNGAMELDKETIQKLQSKGAEIIFDATPKIIEIYNEKIKQGVKTNALIHTTC